MQVPCLHPLLLIIEPAAEASALLSALRARGEQGILLGTCSSLVHQMEALAPRQVICHLPQGVAGLLAALGTLGTHKPRCAITVHAPLADEAELRALLSAGVVAWSLQPDSSALALVHARLRFEHEQALRDQLEERKWIDRAKGLLMAARSIGEDEAFRLLRGAAMHANLKLGEVARSVMDAARWAEAVNRAGQLRMLSQRTVALAAQRVARVEGSAARATQARKRAQANIDHLAALGLEGAPAQALAAVSAAWAELKVILAVKPGAASLVQADHCAEQLLLAAENLTDALQAHGARSSLRIVNLCGRQRMRAQRLAKQAFLSLSTSASLPPASMQQTMDEFEQAMREIEAMPLSSPEIRAALEASREAWLVLLRSLRAADAAPLAHASEALLSSLDLLTESCERSLQLLLS